MAVVEQVDHYQVDQEEVFQEALEEVDLQELRELQTQAVVERVETLEDQERLKLRD
jgi:hypothetical protein|tara:strand:+ start:371 stop:538 length:168 start_codon:yes stop_codon:yes gene_type:complete